MNRVYVEGEKKVRLVLLCSLVGSGMFGFLGNPYKSAGLVLTSGAIFYLVWADLLGIMGSRRRKVPERRLFLLWYFSFVAGIFIDLSSAFVRAPTHALASYAGGLLVFLGTIALTLDFYRVWKHLPAIVDDSASRCFEMMKDAGFAVPSDIWLVVFPRLETPADTYQSGSDQVIRISPVAVRSRVHGGLDKILIHEMSHVYRRVSKHSSHNPEISGPIWTVATKGFTKKYQYLLLKDALLDLDEIFAEDIAFKALQNVGIAWVDSAREEFQDLVRRTPIRSLRPGPRYWKNALLILNNSCWLAQMTRHSVVDGGERADKKNQELLSRLPPGAKSLSTYCYDVMVGLKEEVTPEQYASLLQSYFSRLTVAAETGFGATGMQSPKDGTNVIGPD